MALVILSLTDYDIVTLLAKHIGILWPDTIIFSSIVTYLIFV